MESGNGGKAKSALLVWRGSGLTEAKWGLNSVHRWWRQLRRRGDGGNRGGRRGSGVFEEIGGSDEIARQQLATVCASDPHEVAEPAQEQRVEKNIGISGQKRLHFCKKCRGPAIPEWRQI